MASDLSFPQSWRAEVLTAPPLIAPAGQFIFPQQVPGEEDALARGALQVMVYPARGADFLATFALGFSDPRMLRGVWACPNARELCAIAGGYAYVIDTEVPERMAMIELRPVVEVIVLREQGLLVFVGFHAMVAWCVDGLAWQTERLSWEGVRIKGLQTDAEGVARLHGFGWNMMTDKEVEFAVDLHTGEHTGGGFQATT